jgi:hypothetical protein
MVYDRRREIMAKKKVIDNTIRLSLEQLEELCYEFESHINECDDATIDSDWIEIWKEDGVIKYAVSYIYTHSDTNTKFGELK